MYHVKLCHIFVVIFCLGKLLHIYNISSISGNSGARYIRSSMYNIPCTSDMLKQSHLPIVLNISPFPRLHPKEVSCCDFVLASVFLTAGNYESKLLQFFCLYVYLHIVLSLRTSFKMVLIVQ